MSSVTYVVTDDTLEGELAYRIEKFNERHGGEFKEISRKHYPATNHPPSGSGGGPRLVILLSNGTKEVRTFFYASRWDLDTGKVKDIS